MEKNFFDQFDETENKDQNFFDQFDEQAESASNPDLSAMDASGETVTLEKQVPEPYSPERVDTGNSVNDQLVNAPKAAYTDDKGVSYDEVGRPLNTFRTEETQLKPSEALGEVLDEEGNVTSRAYDGMSYGDAVKVYEALANHPKAEVSESALPGGLQTIFLNGRRVPVPEPEMFGDGAKVSSVQLGGDQILQTASNLYDLLASGANKLASLTGGEEDVPLIERQGIEKEGIVDNVLAEGPVIAGLGATGYRAGNLLVGGNPTRFAGAAGEIQLADGILSRVLGNSSPIVETGVKTAVRGTGVNAATIAGQNNDESGLFTGDEAAVQGARQYVEVLSTEGRTRSGEILANKVNLMADAAVTGIVASGLAGSATAAKKLFYDGILAPIGTFVFDSPQRKRVAEEFIMATGDLPLNATRDQQKAYAERMRNIIQTNRDVLARTPEGEISADLDPMAAFATALESSPNKAEQLEGIRARTVRNDIFSSGLPEPEAKQLTYGQEVRDFQENLYDSGGAAEGVETARSGIVQSGRDEVATTRSAADSAALDVDKNLARTEQIFRMDATVGQKLAALEKDGVDLNIFRRGNESAEQVVKRIEAGETTLRANRDQAYQDLEEAIPDGVPINDPAFNQKFARAENSLSAETVMKWQDEQINDYKQLRLQVLPDVNAAIASTEKGSDQYRFLLELKDSIEKVQYNNLDPAIKQSIQAQKEAVDQANEAYYNWFTTGTLKDVSNSQRRVRNFTESGNTNRSTQLSAEERSTNVVDSLFTNDSRQSMQLVGEFLQTPEGGRSVKPLVDVGIAKLVQASRKTAQTDGIGAINSQQLITSLGNFAATLEKISPKQYTRLQDIIGNIRKHESNGVELQRIAEEAEELAKNTESQVLDRELKVFFEGTGNSRVERSEGQEVFNSVFTDKFNSTNKVADVIRRARSAGPEALRGLKAAFANSFKFTAQSTDKEVKDFNRVMQNARLIYEDQPQVVEALETGFKLIKDTKVENENRIGLKGIGAATESAGILGANRLITMIWGVLNPTATKIRTLTNIGARNFSPRDKMVQLMGQAASDSDEFISILDDFISNGAVNDSRRLFDFMVKAGVYSNTDTDYDSFNEALEQEQMNQESESPDDTNVMLDTIVVGPDDPVEEEDFLR